MASPSLPDVVELLKHDAQQELAAIDWTRTSTRGRWTVSASVVQLSTVREERTLTAWCTVSATLRDQKTGALVAILEGRAQADAPAAERALPSAAARAERGALSGAVRGAVTAIPDAIERMRQAP